MIKVNPWPLYYTEKMQPKNGVISVANRLVNTVPILDSEFTISTTIYPTGTVSGWSNVFHVTTGENIAAYGDRTPGAWFRSDTAQMHICGAVNNNKNYCYNSAALPLNEWSPIKISQSMQTD